MDRPTRQGNEAFSPSEEVDRGPTKDSLQTGERLAITSSKPLSR